MKQPTPTDWFARFRELGDLEALALAFDGTAPELLRVAGRLASQDAEDLVQATFLTAIERASRFDASRSLQPWLLGILLNHVRNERRRASRNTIGEVPELASEREPHDELEARELSTFANEALGGLTRAEREVLEPYLSEERAPSEIARAQGLRPGAARMRIHRALHRLRRLLPAGLALGGAARSASALLTVRARVLEAGRRSRFGPTASVTGSGVLTGAQALLWSLGAAAFVLVGALVLRTRADGGTAVTAGGSATLTQEGRRKLVESPSPGQVDRVPVAIPQTGTESRAAVAPEEEVDLRAWYGSLRGRLVEHDGTPVPHTRVQLVQWRGRWGLPALSEAYAGGAVPDLLGYGTSTNDEGVFVLQHVDPHGLSMLLVDAGGPRGSLRLLPHATVSQAQTNVGDVRLSPFGMIRGRILDQAGHPVAGVRVRAGDVAEMFAKVLAPLRAGDGIWNEKIAMALPRWLCELERMLPIPRTETDSEGRFELSHVPSGPVTIAADHPGFVPFWSRTELVPFQTLELGELELDPGRTLQGTVVDAQGRPVPDAEVLLGTLPEPDARDPWPLKRARVDEQGRFQLSGLNEDQLNVAAFRADERMPWQTQFSVEPTMELKLPAPTSLALELIPGEGVSLDDVRIEVYPSVFPVDWITLFEFRPARAEFVREGNVWTATDLLPGLTHIVVRPGLGVLTLMLEERENEAELRMAPTRKLDVFVTDRAGEPVPGAQVTVRYDFWTGPRPQDASTDSAGHARLEDLHGERPAFLEISHPGHAQQTVPFDVSATDELHVALEAGATLPLMLGESAPGKYLVRIFRDGSWIPILRLVDESGRVVLKGLNPGEYSLKVYEPFLDYEVFSLLQPKFEPTILAGADFAVTPGLNPELVVPLRTRATRSELEEERARAEVELLRALEAGVK